MSNYPTPENDDNHNNFTNESEDYFIDITRRNSLSFIEMTNPKVLEIQSMLISNLNTIGSGINKFFEKIIPNTDLFSLSMKLVNNYIRSQYVTQDSVESAIEHFLNFLEESTTFIFTEEKVLNLGILLYYSFKRFHSFRIKNIDRYKEILDKIRKDHSIDPISDYNQFIKTSKKIPNHVTFWKDKEKKYFAPPEFIFLIRLFENIKKLKFALDDFNKDHFYFFILILKNTELIFTNIDEIILDYTFSDYFKIVFEKFQKKLNKEEKNFGKFVKNYNFNEDCTFKHLWDFNSNYIYPNKKLRYSYYDAENESYDSSSIVRDSVLSFSETTPEQLTHQKNSFTKMVVQYQLFFEIMIIIVNIVSSLKNIKKMEIVFLDSFARENLVLLKDIFHINVISSIHFLDLLLSNKSSAVNIKEFNIEFNAIDDFSCGKAMSLINSMKNLHTLRISIFCPDEIYLPAGLLKLVFELRMNIEKIFGQKKSGNSYFTDETDSDQLMISHLLDYFEKNMFLLLFVLMRHQNLKHLSIFADTPLIITSNENYTTTIIKFIFNLFLHLNTKNSILTKLKLIFPNLVLDSRKFPGIIDFLEDINYSQINYSLLQLHLQFQLYEIKNIHKLLTPRLNILTLGNLDLQTFRAVAKFCSSYGFSVNSELKELTLGMMPIVTDYGKVKEAFEILFGTHIKNLERLNIFSHITIHKEDYAKFLKVLNKNWIRTYLFEFDKKTKDEIMDYEQKNEKEVKNFYIEENFEFAKAVEYVIIAKRMKYKTRTLKRINGFLFNSVKSKVNLQMV